MKKKLFLVLFSICFVAQAHVSPQNVMEELLQENVHFVQFLFSDLLGNTKEITIPIDHIEDALEHGIAFDGSSVAGCANISASDMILKPDPQTTRLIPWLQGQNKTALMLGNIYLDHDRPFLGDPRNLLNNVSKQLLQEGYSPLVGPELEFFILTHDNKPIDTNNYFAAQTDIKRVVQHQSLIHALKNMGINVEKLHHEVASGQYEFSIRYGSPIEIADQIILAKYTLTSILREYGCKVTFMPKPFQGQNGSAMHIHFSLWDEVDQRNAFYDQDDAQQLSAVAKQSLAGVLHHIPSIAALFNPTINSYKRLVPGYEAPIYICWGTKNRSALLRIPQVDHPNAVRAELRCPDPLCNPYLAFAGLLSACHDGIKHQRDIPQPVEENLYKLTPEALLEKEIASLPTNLGQAISALKESTFAHNVLGEHMISSFVRLKEKELHDYNVCITDWEIERYL